jgi:Arc/MetJ-type ribon-helix-helix transcriptional regulator
MMESDAGAESTGDSWLSAEERAKSAAQARALRAQAKEGGLDFAVYLPPDMADWVLGLIESGQFQDPGDAVFVMLQQAMELEPHRDLREELLRRMLQEARNDPRPPIPAKEVFKRLREKFAQPRPVPAKWE